jgi:predicted GIY-YIG superfamily endonuclease
MSNSHFSMVYALELENSKYYIGFSDNVNVRLKKHFSGEGSAWTKMHKPIKVIECVIGDKSLERIKTLEYMSKFGWENVRGAAWCMTDIQKPPDSFTEFLKRNDLFTDSNCFLPSSDSYISDKKIIDSYVYALELFDNKYYIGCERHNTNTVERHMSGNGSPWTTEHKPICVIEKFFGTKQAEKLLTLIYMKKYGYQNVRGYSWSQITLRSPPKELATFDISSYCNVL